LLQTWLLLLFLLAFALTVLTVARADASDQTRESVLGVARTVGLSPFVVSAATTSDAPARLAAYAENVRRANGVDFVVIMGTDRTRWTHPDPAKVGKQFVGTVGPALQGRTFTETFSGSPDPSVRAVAPVRDAEGRIVALVAVGDQAGSVWSVLGRAAPLLALVVVLALALAYAAPVLARRRPGRSSDEPVGAVSPPGGSAPGGARPPRP
jgi:sensor histidine kinase regulating citrate/malate metabolism